MTCFKSSLFASLFFLCFHAGAQQYKDTTFRVREHTCSCKYNYNEEDDKDTYFRDGKSISTTVERAAYYPGDWEKFVKKNLDKGFKGKDKVEVRIQVDRNGNLINYELQSRSPAQKFQEVVRVLKLSGPWFPAIRNGYCVSSFVKHAFEL